MINSSMIPQKSSFKFQELTPITGVKPYVIRFWETEFQEISPTDNDSGQKIYSRQDVEYILKIKELLFDHKLSIPEAKKALSHINKEEDEISSPSMSMEETAMLSNHFDVSEICMVLKSALNEISLIKERRNW